MAFGITGFGAGQVSVAPQLFQALSVSGQPPQAPAPPFGTPNPNLVPAARSGSPVVPANLTLAAHPAFTAILQVTGQSVLAVGHPALPSRPFTTTAIGATNPAITAQSQGPAPAGVPVLGNPPAGPVSFALTTAPASLTSGINALQQTIASLQAAEEAASAAAQQPASTQPSASTQQSPATTGTGASNAGTLPSNAIALPSNAPHTTTNATAPTFSAHAAPSIPAASATIVGKIAQTIQSLAIAAVYPTPVFSLSA
ncbi:MAG TPA: hypothetical protein VNG31_07570 [Candidatus Baltobacteraceae bacterium]|nr:hypothetical protein [Candidatus Baltobacteraceae bacterium]